MMKKIRGAIIAAVLAASAVFGRSTSELPNIVLIYVDDMGVGEASYAGGLIPTPAIDSLANDGMQFTDAHSSSAVCTPSRYSLLTGRYNWRSPLKSMVLLNMCQGALMDPERLNMPTFLQKAGYHTACIGKWHLGSNWVRLPESANPDKTRLWEPSWLVDYTKPFKNGPVDVGFDEAFFIDGSLDMPPYVYLRNDRAEQVPTMNKGWEHNEYSKFCRIGAGAEDFDAHNCLADWTAESRSYIKRRAEDKSKKPFFLYLSLTSPHTPITPGKAFKGRYKQYSWYADFMAETDWVVEQVLEQLEESGVEDNTIVIFTADNGFAPYVGIPKMIEAGYRPSGHFRNAKGSLYEGGHRVPFLVRWPGKIKANSKSDETICQTDLYATFADILGKSDAIPDDAAEDSFSFYSALKGKKGKVRPFTIHHSHQGLFAIRKGDWKLILDTAGGGGSGNIAWETIKTPAKMVQLYNMKEDSGETKNLEDVHPEIIEELVNDLAKALRDGRTTPGEIQKNDGCWPYIVPVVTKERYPQLRMPVPLTLGSDVFGKTLLKDTKLASLRFYDRVLSADEIKQLSESKADASNLSVKPTMELVIGTEEDGVITDPVSGTTAKIVGDVEIVETDGIKCADFKGGHILSDTKADHYISRPVSFDAWVNIGDKASGMLMSRFNPVSADQDRYYLQLSGGVNMYFWEPNRSNLVFPMGLRDKLIHLAIVSNSKESKVYINGELSNFDPAPLVIGAMQGGKGGGFGGDMATVRIYDKALDADAAATLAQTKPGKTDLSQKPMVEFLLGETKDGVCVDTVAGRKANVVNDLEVAEEDGVKFIKTDSSGLVVNENTPMDPPKDYALEVWIRNKKAVPGGRILDKTGGRMLFDFESGGIRFMANNKHHRQTPWTKPANEWIHLIAVHENGAATVYIDGKKAENLKQL